MRYPILFLYLLATNAALLAQGLDCSTLPASSYAVCDNFADADLSNPTWTGDIAQFTVNANGQLQSNSTGTDTISLSTPINSGLPEEWRIKVNMDFDPSDNNRSNIYLFADQADLKSNTLNAYYLRLGENGSLDAISLYRQAGSAHTLVVRGTDATVALSPNLYIKVNRSAAGEWQIATAPDGGTYSTDATATDNTFSAASGFMGVWCKHTSANVAKFYFDDIYVSLPPADNVAPQALSATLLNPSTVNVLFSEAINPATAQVANNYALSGGIDVSSAEINGINPAIVQLSLSAPLVSGNNYQLNISNVSDLAGNVMQATTFMLSFYNIQPHDVLINEILADPDPQVGLPPYEFVELYNRTNVSIDLSGWQFGDNPDAPQTILPNISIPANGYLILCSNAAANVEAYTPFGTTVGLAGFPSLNNSGDALVLLDNNNNLIDAVTYSDDWFESTNKRDGGWTLELVNANIACETAGNWHEANATAGGTPGAVNSVSGLFNDTTAPQILSVQVIDNQSIALLTDEPINPATAQLLSNYSISNGITISSISIDNNSGVFSINLNLATSLAEGTLYSLTANNLADCSGNVAATYSDNFALPQTADTYDILITEIYADYEVPEIYPQPNLDLPATKYIELYNRSTKTISLQNWYLTDLADTVTLNSYVLLPDSRVVLCSNTKVSLFSERGIPALGVTSFPEPNTTSDLLSIYNAEGLLIYSVNYDKTWYKDPIKQEGGWALEMIDTANPCEEYANWSASTNPQGGTPAAANSIARSNPDEVVPDLLRAEVINPTLVLLYFSEILDRNTAQNIANYTLNNSIGQPIDAELLAPSNKQVLLTLGTALQVNTVYELTANLLTDCAGNAIGIYNTTKVGIAQTPEKGDIVINEILFNPAVGGYDFIELYNSSTKILSLSNWYFAQVDIAENPDSVTAYLPLLSERYTLFPDEYAVLTENPESVIAYYSQCGATVPANTFVKADLPTLNDDEGIVAILSLSGDTLDNVHYFDSWHNPLLDTPDGFSLERIDYSKPAQNANNWQSGASAVCGATPGYKNSQFHNTSGSTDANSISIEPTALSPDGDGYNDFTTINYSFDQGGYVLDIMIYDERGREVHHLVRNDIAATEGYYKWDGTLADGNKAKVGIYVLRLQAFDAEGTVHNFKKTVAVVGKQ